MRGGQAGGMLRRWAGEVTVNACSSRSSCINYAYVNKDDADVYEWDPSTQSFQLYPTFDTAQITLNSQLPLKPHQARHAGGGRAALHMRIVSIDSRPLHEQFGPGGDTGTRTLAGHIPHGDLPRMEEVARDQGKVYVSFITADIRPGTGRLDE